MRMDLTIKILGYDEEGEPVYRPDYEVDYCHSRQDRPGWHRWDSKQVVAWGILELVRPDPPRLRRSAARQGISLS
jgi:hypothetical protein